MPSPGLHDPIAMPSLFEDLPESAGATELFETLLQRQGVDMKIERIVSHGHVSPPEQDRWYDQPHEEFVLVVRGSAAIDFTGSRENVELEAGDWLYIPAHQKHRVSRTAPGRPTVWLAVHFGMLLEEE
jgi:cupin 2 domain-containing protein